MKSRMCRPVAGLISLIATLVAAPAFAQDPVPVAPPTGTVAFQPSVARPAGLPFSPAALAGIARQQTLTQPEWQRQYDAAKTRRKSGQKKFLIGVGMGVGGTLMMAGGYAAAMSDDCDPCRSAQAVALIGTGLVVGGGVSFWWGIMDWAQGNGALNRLQATKPVGGLAHSVPLTEHQALQFSLGARAGIGYRVAW
jgi:hypothetical protein